MAGRSRRPRTVVDLEGSQVDDVFLVDAGDVTEGLSNGRTFDYGSSVALTVGSELYSSRSRLLATIVADDVGVSRLLYAPCSQAMFERLYGASGPIPTATTTSPGHSPSSGCPRRR